MKSETIGMGSIRIYFSVGGFFNVHQNVRKLTLGALLLLPLVAVGVAVTLMLSWGDSQGAEAAGPTPEISASATTPSGSCDTNPNTGTGAKCSADVGSTVQVSFALDKTAGLTDQDGDMKSGWNSVQLHVQDNANLTLQPQAGVAEVKNCAGGIAAEAGGDGDYGAVCNIGVGQNERTDTGNMFRVDYQCTTQGTGTVTQINGGGLDTQITDEGNVAVPAGPAATQVLSINCLPPAGVIQINKTDDVTGALIGPSCWQLFVRIVTVSPPSDVNQPVDVVGDNGKVCAGATGFASDGNAALGEIDITISGAAQNASGSDEWHVLETQAPPKYGIGVAAGNKSACDFGTANPCVLNLTDPRIAGNINILMNDSVTGQPLTGQCVDVDATTVCDGAAGDTDGANDGDIHVTVALGAHTCAYNDVNQPADRLVKAPTSVDCSLSATAPKANVKYNFNPTIPFNLKNPTHANLFLTAQGAKLPPSTCAAATNTAVFTHTISNAPTTADPKDPSEVQQVGGFEMDVIFDEDLVCVNLAAGAYFTGTAGGVCFIDDKDQGLQPDGLARIGCVVKGKPTAVSPSLELAIITVRPQPELYKLITADQDNGVQVSILNSGCNLADMQGHPIKKIGCDDSIVDIRWLEGDVNGDCAVDVADQQILAFRWGAKLGQGALYNDRFDLEPSGQINSDGDIDIKDVQFVYGRHGSTCAVPHPDQDPRNPNETNP
jgi:hypothetical protein